MVINQYTFDWAPTFKSASAFTCAGILPSQYNHFSEFSGMGVVGKRYIGTGKHIALHLCINKFLE